MVGIAPARESQSSVPFQPLQPVLMPLSCFVLQTLHPESQFVRTRSICDQIGAQVVTASQSSTVNLVPKLAKSVFLSPQPVT